jgi:hypothetical protein
VYLDTILKSFDNPKKRAYKPVFRIEAEGRNWRIFDGDTAIALFLPGALDIWKFSPFEPAEIANPEPAGKVKDLHTLHNTYLNFGAQGWPKAWLAAGVANRVVWKWLKRKGAELEALVSVAAPEGETGQWRLRYWYDPSWARYRFTCEIDVARMDPEGMEAFNMMTAGALEACAEKRRWTHSIWENSDGELRRIVHSNALFQCTDYGGARDGGGPWRHRNIPYRGAWVGYAAHPSFNPAILVRETTVPLRLATCSQLFDEHIIWNTAGQDNVGGDGYHHFHMLVEFVNLKPKLAADFLRRAKDPVKPKKWNYSSVALPFHLGVVNSFEKEADPWAAEDCPIICLPEDQEAKGIAWARIGHTGKRSIQLASGAESGRREIYPSGAVCRVKLHTRYRLTGWIKTGKVERFARLELGAIEYSFANVIDAAFSPTVSGSRNWTRVSVELDSGDEAYLMPKLVLYGRGRAWFDDVCLEELAPA